MAIRSHMLPRLLLAAPLPGRLSRRTAAPMSSAPAAPAPPAPLGHRMPPLRLRGVVFDMDGTLTVPVIDFPAMYREVLGGDAAYAAARAAGGGSVDILHCIESWAPDEQRRAYEVIARFEQEGLDRLRIMPGKLLRLRPMLISRTRAMLWYLGFLIDWSRIDVGFAGASELCGFLDTKQIRRGLITRNVKSAVDLFHQRFGMMFSPALSREFRPYKPDPAPLLHICSTWDIPPNEVIMVGDSLKDDVVCGKRAGAFTCLLDETGRYGPHDSLPEDIRPDFTVSSLSEVFSVLEEHFDLAPVVSESTI
ncbi:hypothetical protein ABZP36_023362 [Zizania latifolia]